MKSQLQQPDLSSLRLEDLLVRWSTMLWWATIRPVFQKVIEANLSFSEHIIIQSLGHGSMRVAQVAECLCITHSAASRAVDRVVEAGFVHREEDPDDRRQKILTLSTSGKDFVTQFEHVLAGAIQPLIANLDPQTEQQFRALLSSILTAHCPLQECPEPQESDRQDDHTEC